MSRLEPTLDRHRQGPFAADIALYDGVAATLRTELAALPAPLSARLAPTLETLIAGEFTQTVGLLPFWLRDLLPVDEATCHELACAQVYGWWYYWAQDEILDGSQEPEALIGGHLALLAMVERYGRLGLRETPCWGQFAALSAQAANAYSNEMALRFTHLDEIAPERLAGAGVEHIAARAAAFYFNALGQAELAGLGWQSGPAQAVQQALVSFTVIRQLTDDASDWIADLQSGHVNAVAAQLIAAMSSTGRLSPGTALDLEQLVGFQVHAEELWAQLEAECTAQATAARTALAPYGQTTIGALLERQAAKATAYWEESRTNRKNLCALFGLARP